jgi:hypothetical protein
LVEGHEWSISIITVSWQQALKHNISGAVMKRLSDEMEYRSGNACRDWLCGAQEKRLILLLRQLFASHAFQTPRRNRLAFIASLASGVPSWNEPNHLSSGTMPSD